MTSGFRHKVNENCTLLGYYAVSSSNQLLKFQYNLLVPSLGDKMGWTRCPETLARNYYYMLHSDREERSSKLLLSVQTSGCHHMSQFEYKCCINNSILSNISMHALMSYKTALMSECLITYCTAVRAITIMYGSMCYQIALLTKCLFTHTRVTRITTTKYASMYCQFALSTECLIT
jgi:hypothetical protein